MPKLSGNSEENLVFWMKGYNHKCGPALTPFFSVNRLFEIKEQSAKI
jgi:hypothetical protein